jgi:hypothetical protein
MIDLDVMYELRRGGYEDFLDELDRQDYFEREIEAADNRRKERKEEALIASMKEG